MATPAPSDEISPYDRLYWPDELLRHCLATGEHRRELALLFGHDAHAELSALARAALEVPRDPRAPTVWLVPGIMGSQLGLPRGPGEPPDLIWLDPVDVMRGDLLKLRLTPDSPVRALGLVSQSYLRLWLRLLAAGFDVQVFPYDWRRSVAATGAQLAAAICAQDRPTMLVAHSLGGLVARAALRHAVASARIQRIVQLGTPNEGAAGARMALNGCYPVVRRVGMLDRRHDARELSSKVFASFRSVHELLPESLERPAALAPADARFQVIAGDGQLTCTAASLVNGGWRYRFSRAGDGTVGFASARLAEVPCYVTDTEHSELPRSAVVTAAVVDLLRTGRTGRLRCIDPHADAALPAHPNHSLMEQELMPTPDGKIDWAAWAPEQRREFLEHLNAPLPNPALADL